MRNSLAQANVDPATTKELFKQVELESVKIGATGEERDSGGSFVLVFGVGFIMYLAILMYGQVILGAVIEEKETRIAEILFSSVKPFTLMMGKLVGVSLVALTRHVSGNRVCGVRLLWCQHVDVTRRACEYSENSCLTTSISRCSSCSAISLRDDLRARWIDGDDGPGRWAVGDADHSDTRGQLLFLPVSRSPDSAFSFWVSMLPFPRRWRCWFAS